jgi:hypothetical protein
MLSAKCTPKKIVLMMTTGGEFPFYSLRGEESIFVRRQHRADALGTWKALLYTPS